MKKTTLVSILFAASAAVLTSPLHAETLPYGIEVTHVTKGTGAKPKPTDAVTVHYRGTLTTGQEFDSSYRRNQPATFPLSGVIPCWTMGVQQIAVGGKAKLTCPSATAYGPQAMPGIPSNSTLIFEIELLGIAK
jgi:FKBP-type peptidyl-prolyl cis-trans isomerase FkpA